MTDEGGTKTGFAWEMARHDLALLLAATCMVSSLSVLRPLRRCSRTVVEEGTGCKVVGGEGGG